VVVAAKITCSRKPVTVCRMHFGCFGPLFLRASMRRAADRELREARWNSYSDIGAA
jgi:hypothetical protein